MGFWDTAAKIGKATADHIKKQNEKYARLKDQMASKSNDQLLDLLKGYYKKDKSFLESINSASKTEAVVAFAELKNRGYDADSIKLIIST